MFSALKKHLYFVVAAYLAFWAKFVLRRWQPRVIVVTGSTGKTTVFHMIEAQLGDQRTLFSHHANSSHGLPFLLLGLNPNIERPTDWLTRALTAPFRAWRKAPRQEFFVAEADADRPHEADFLSKFLQPEVTIWVSVYRTHSMNFDPLVHGGKFKTHEEAIAYEFGWFPARTSKLVIANGDQPVLSKQLSRVPEDVVVQTASAKDLTSYKIEPKTTDFTFEGQTIKLPGLHPRELGNSLQMVNRLMQYLDLPLDPSYSQLNMPPGRSSIFQGQKEITIIDSTYNTGLGAMTAILHLFADYPAQHKWIVLGDILEQGSVEAEEHRGLGKVIAEIKPEHIVLLGPRTAKDTAPVVKELLPSTPLATFESPKEVLDYLQANLKGGEAVLFKGGRFLEGVIEQLLANPEDAEKLVRRDPVWTKRRQKWGLPR